MKKLDELTKKFIEFKQELNKNVNNSYGAQPNGGKGATPLAMGEEGFKTEKIEFAKNGQWSLDKVDPEENINIPHPQKAPKMSKPVPQPKVNKGEDDLNDENTGRIAATPS